MIKNAQLGNILTLAGSSEGLNIENIVDRLLNVIEKDSATERISREGDLIKGI